MKNQDYTKSKKILLVKELGLLRYECSICGYYYKHMGTAKQCYESCHAMVAAYMDVNNLSFKDARKKFLMEIL